MPHLHKMALQAIPAGTRLIAEMQPTPACGHLVHQFADMIGTVRHRAPLADLTAALAARNRDRERRLVDIQPDERAIL
ncbi:hypothetical protein CCR87_04860 [Rhodobaculum claviforme]|uniref:Uncharacterized protein n=1 Tax=Rhodobaculum claviforme TaxID=1549854 RepID=A0A934TK41_9RHOB|nr:hypothetical protein [Rhodobaculum claviforme]